MLTMMATQDMTNDERVPNGRKPLKDAYDDVWTMRTFGAMDADGDERITTPEVEAWVTDTFDSDASGRLEDAEQVSGVQVPVERYEAMTGTHE